MTHNPLPAVFGTALLLLLPAGCAKGPAGMSTGGGGGGGGITGKQLVVTLRVRGQIDLANDYYYIVFNAGTAASPAGIPRNGFTGPQPVVTDFERGGNGFAGGAFTMFVECHQNEPLSSNFGLYGTDSTLLQRIPLNVKPIQESVSGGTATFQIPLADIAMATSNATGTTITEAQITTLEVNFIATNVVPVNPQDTSVKYFDALGDPRAGQLNAFVTLSTAQDTTYSNDTLGGSEPADDVATYATSASTTQTDYSSSVQVVPDQTPAGIANLDIADVSSLPAWSIEIRG